MSESTPHMHYIYSNTITHPPSQRRLSSTCKHETASPTTSTRTGQSISWPHTWICTLRSVLCEGLSSDSSEVVPHWQWQLGGELWTPATHLFFIKVYDNPCNHGYTPTYLSRFQHFIGKTWVCCKQHPTCFLPQVNSSSSFWSPPILGPMGSSRWATRGGFLWDPIRIQSTENKNHRDLLNKDTGGWFQPIWKIWVNLDHFPK